MNGIEELAAIMKSNKPQPRIGITTGKVKSASPLEILVDDKIIAKSPNLFVAQGFSPSEGDDVIIIASDNNKIFYAIARSVPA